MANSNFGWNLIHGNFLLSGLYWLIFSCLNTCSVAGFHYRHSCAVLWYRHQLVKPPLLNIASSILNCHSSQFSHSVSTKTTLLTVVFVSVSVDQPHYKWNHIITISNTSKVNYLKCRFSFAVLSAPLWRWNKVSCFLWFPSLKVHTRVFRMNCNFFIKGKEARSSSVFYV